MVGDHSPCVNQDASARGIAVDGVKPFEAETILVGARAHTRYHEPTQGRAQAALAVAEHRFLGGAGASHAVRTEAFIDYLLLGEIVDEETWRSRLDGVINEDTIMSIEALAFAIVKDVGLVLKPVCRGHFGVVVHPLLLRAYRYVDEGEIGQEAQHGYKDNGEQPLFPLAHNLEFWP